MREQIEAISKQVEKIKEIAFTNRDHLEYENQDLTQGEIEKIRQSQKITDDITTYNIVNEYEKMKKLNGYIRYGYLALMVIIIGFLCVITFDYIQVKIKNESVKQIEKEKLILQKQTQDLTQKVGDALEKNNSLTALVKQKDEQIEILKKSISTSFEKKPTFQEETLPEEVTPLAPNILSSTSSGTTSSLTQTGAQNTPPDIKRCTATTTITINVRDTAGIDGKVLSFLNEGSEVEVLSKQNKNDRIWYEIKTSKLTGWISSVGIEEFDTSCLK